MEEMEEQFPWIPMIKRGFLKSFPDEYEVGTLELLEQNITEEILKVKCQYDSERAKLLFHGIKDFYNLFCRKWYQCKKFSTYMEVVWVHIMSSFLKIGLLLSQEKNESKWISRVSTSLMRFPGEKNLMYDALLSVNCLNKKYQFAYGSILWRLLIQVSSFVPMIINDPAEYLKVCLLFRRLKFLTKDPGEISELQMKASKILAPSTLLNWLLVHDFNVKWLKRAVRIDLQMNIFKKLMGKKWEKEVVETIRKILLPRICTERKADLERPFSGLNETDRFTAEGNIADNFDNRPLFITDSFKNRNHVSGAYDDWVPRKNDKENTLSETEVKNEKMKNKRNYVCVRSGDEVSSAGDYTALNETELNRKKMKRRENDVCATLNEPLLLEDGEKEIAASGTEIKSKKTKRKRSCVSADGQEQVQMEKSKKEQQNSFMCNNDFGAESKSKKKKQRKEVLITTEKNPEIMLETSSETTKRRKKLRKGQKAKELGSNSKEIELITISHDTDADNLPVIVNEINVSESVPNERLRLPEFRNMNPASSYSDDEPVIVTEVKHYPFVLGSSRIKKSKPIETELNSNTETVTENNFVIDAKPSPCIPESHAVQITYDSEQKGVASCEKSENSENERESNSSVNLADLQDKQLLSETNSSLKNVDKNHTYEETQDSCTGKSSPIKDDQQDGHSQIFCALPVSNLVDDCVSSEKETNVSSSEQTDLNVNSQDCKQEDGGNVFSPNMEERSDHINQTKEESSRNSAAQTESVSHSSNQASDFRDIESDLTSEKLGIKSEKSPIQVDFKKETTREIDISQEDVPALESRGSCISDLSSLNDDSCAQETKVQKDDNTSFETDSVELKHEAPLEHSISDLQENKSFVQSMDDPLNTNISSPEIKKEKLVTDSSLPNKNDSEVVSNSGSNDSFEVDNPTVLKDYTSVDIHSPSRNDSVHEVTVLFEVKSPVLKTGDSQIPVDENQNLGVKAKIDEVKTPNSSAANGLMEKLVKLASDANDESVRQNILEVDLPSTGLSPDFLCLTSLKNEKSVKCLSFLDISTESVHSNSAIQSFSCHASKSSEFLQYRDLSGDLDDVRSEDTLSEHKSILKADASEYPSDASNGTEGEESNSLSDCSSHASSNGVPEASNSMNNYDTYVVKSEICFMHAIERHRFCKEEDLDETYTRVSQGIAVDISTKRMLNPVVNLGERCDSKTFIFANSGASADEEINETKPFESNQAPSTVDEITEKPEMLVENSPSNTHVSFAEKCYEIGEVINDVKIEIGEVINDVQIEIGEVINDVKIEIQPGQKDAKEVSLTPGQEMTVSDESQGSVELTSKKELSQGQELTVCNEDQESVELTSDKELSQNQEGTRCNKGKKLTVCNEDQESVELTSDKDLSEDQEGTRGEKGQELTENRKENFLLSLNMKLRKRPAPTVQTQMSALADEDSSVLNPNSPTTSARSLRSRNPPASSQKVRKSRSQTVTRRSSKRLKKEVNMNLGFDFSELSLNSPRTLRSKPNSESSNKSSSEVAKDNVEPPTINQENPCRRSTRASVVSSNVDTKIKDQDSDPEGYNLRSRKPVIMPGRLKF